MLSNIKIVFITLSRYIFSGLIELLSSAEGILSLLALISVSFLCYRKCVSDLAFGAVCTMIPSVFAYCAHKVDIKNLELPPRGQP